MKNQPITAKIKRTTKGGITQPLLNMGAPVKMMAPPPAPTKQIVKKLIETGVKVAAKRMLPAVRNVGVSTTKKAIQKSAPRTIEVVGRTVANPKNTGGGFMNIAKKVMKYGALGVAGYALSKLGGNQTVPEAKAQYDSVKPTVKTKKKKYYDQAF
jgi:hypothetical protein